MIQQSVITDEMRSVIGVESEPYSYEVDKNGIRKFAEAVGDPNPLWTDELYARKTMYGGIIASPTFITTVDRRQKEGYHHGGKPYKRPYEKGLHGSDEWEFFEPLRPGDVITARRRMVDFVERQGKSGPLLFTFSEADYYNQLGQLVAKHRTSGISFP